MAYLLDSDTLIEAKNRLYAFDLCPGFWAFLEEEAIDGEIRSIARIQAELVAGGDELATWARANGGFFLPDTPEMHTAMGAVSQWVQNHPRYRDGAKRDFLAKADSFLVAYALAHGHTVVTNEVDAPDAIKAVKIPSACIALNVPYTRLSDVLRVRGAAFTWVR
jgi:Domain of unknown function (DUF4411)